MGLAILLLSALAYIAIILIVAYLFIFLFKKAGMKPAVLQIFETVFWAVIAIVCIIVLLAAIQGSLTPITNLG